MLKLTVLSRKRNVLEVAVTENKGRGGLFHYRYLTPGDEFSIPLSIFEQEVVGGVFGLSESGMKKIRSKAVLGVSTTRKYGKRTYDVHLVKGNVKDILSYSLMTFKPKQEVVEMCPSDALREVHVRLKSLTNTVTINPTYLKAVAEGLAVLESKINELICANKVLIDNRNRLNDRIDKMTAKLAKVNK